MEGAVATEGWLPAGEGSGIRCAPVDLDAYELTTDLGAAAPAVITNSKTALDKLGSLKGAPPEAIDTFEICYTGADHYLCMLYHSRPKVKAVLLLLMDPANRPGMVNCTAGKDRTGLICFLLLLAVLGVSRADNLAHFMLSNRPEVRASMAAKLGALATKFGVDPHSRSWPPGATRSSGSRRARWRRYVKKTKTKNVTFRPKFRPCDCSALDDHVCIYAWGAAFSCQRLILADVVLI